LFTKKIRNEIFICQIYVHDIIFGSTNEDFCKEFGEMMSREFEMSMIGELSFFLGLQIKQLKEGTFVCQSKYVKDILKNLAWKMQNPSRLLWLLMEILILMREVNRSILSFIGL
jgi:hypothetical protein